MRQVRPPRPTAHPHTGSRRRVRQARPRPAPPRDGRPHLAEAWGLRRDGGNPCRFVQKYKEQKRERFLSDDEFRRLDRVLAETLAVVSAVRLLMPTGCRLNEVQTLRWEDVDPAAGELRLRDRNTGARMVPLSKAAASEPSALPRNSETPWVIVGGSRPLISPTCSILCGAFARAPDSTMCEFTICGTR